MSSQKTTEPGVGSIGDGIHAGPAEWHFNGETPKHFSTHILRSVPDYNAGHSLIEEISDSSFDQIPLRMKSALQLELFCENWRTGTATGRAGSGLISKRT
jgi:hypothetical protein